MIMPISVMITSDASLRERFGLLINLCQFEKVVANLDSSPNLTDYQKISGGKADNNSLHSVRVVDHTLWRGFRMNDEFCDDSEGSSGAL